MTSRPRHHLIVVGLQRRLMRMDVDRPFSFLTSQMHMRQLQRASLDQQHLHGDDLSAAQLKAASDLAAERERVLCPGKPLTRGQAAAERSELQGTNKQT